MVRSRYPRGAVEVRSWRGRGTRLERSSTVEVRSWCASGSVRLVNFSTGDTVYTPYSTCISSFFAATSLFI